MGTIADQEQQLESTAQPVAGTSLWRRLLGGRGLLRITLLAATAAFYAAAVVEHTDPLVMAVGLAPLAWLALEAVWHLFAAETLNPLHRRRARRLHSKRK